MKAMRKNVFEYALAAAALVVLVVALGCASTGLSPREVRGQDFSTYLLALYEPGSAQPAGDAAPKPVRLPIRVAVAQVGEIAPPDEVLATLRGKTDAFDSVQSIPGITDVSGQMSYAGHSAYHAPQMRQAAGAHVERMRRLARDIGADYLFLYGGTIDQATTSTPLSAADLTIIGGFLVPSKRIEGVAKASGALLEVDSGRVVVSVSAARDARRLSPTFARDNGELTQLKKLRDGVVLELAQQLAERVKAEATPVAATGG
jgi:hypothetical protein